MFTDNEAFTVKPESLKSPTSSVSVITGGSSGIGLQTTILLASICPNNKIAVLDINPPISQASKELVNSNRFLFLQCNVTDWKSQRAAFEKVIEKFGAIDNVFANAGIIEYREQFFNDEKDESGKLAEPDRRVYTVDLNAANDTVKLAIYHMRHRNDGRKGGNIVITASLAGYVGTPGAPLYSAAKHGVVGLMRALKGECATMGIAISAIAPAITITQMTSDYIKNETLADWTARVRKEGLPLNEPEEIAANVVQLFSEGMRASGKGLLIQNGRTVDLERGIAKTRQQWMGKEMLGLFRSGMHVRVFDNKL